MLGAVLLSFIRMSNFALAFYSGLLMKTVFPYSELEDLGRLLLAPSDRRFGGVLERCRP